MVKHDFLGPFSLQNKHKWVFAKQTTKVQKTEVISGSGIAARSILDEGKINIFAYLISTQNLCKCYLWIIFCYLLLC